MRKAILFLAALAAVLGGVWLYPVGGRIWTAAQVSGLALVREGRRAELSNPAALPHAAQDALLAARLDRFRRIAPALRGGPCVPLDLALRKGNVWVNVSLKCTDGLTFDDIDRDAWR